MGVLGAQVTRNSDYVDAGAKWVKLAGNDPLTVTRIFRDRDNTPQVYADGYTWLGDLAGYWLEQDITDEPRLHHTCGWETSLPFDWECRSFLANVVVAALEHKCPKRAAA